MLKRLTDVIGSLGLIIATSPVWLGVAFWLLVAYRGRKIIFAQQRIGLHGIPFVLYKFRTLRTVQARNTGHSRQNETFTGKYLRKFSIDELPQLINVLKGEMSLVGPRPLPVEYEEPIKKYHSWRMEMKPGISGLVQIQGRNSLSWEQRFAKDYQYYKSRSFSTDMKILLQTLLALVRAEGNIPSETLNYK